mmetsp:Transcript_28087/g.40201  ORF Transcript_28087/g.40201 Transcript_28087/m.40201 type:complete len:103 (-) Transcript_28087:169-477(-)
MKPTKAVSSCQNQKKVDVEEKHVIERRGKKIVEIMGMQKQRYVFPRTERASPTLPLESLMINVHQESMLCFIESAPFIAANFPHEIFFPNAFQKADLRLCVF